MSSPLKEERAGTRRGVRRPSGKGVCLTHTLRPTSSKVKESVFNILRGRMEGAVFVDLYAGTGAVGMDAMSEGADTVYFVEADGRRAARIGDLLSGCRCAPKAVVVHSKALDFLRRALVEGLRFDIIFVDPPYASHELGVVLPFIAENGLLAEGGTVIAEHATRTPLEDRVGGLVRKKTYKYGDTSLTLYTQEEA